MNTFIITRVLCWLVVAVCFLQPAAAAAQQSRIWIPLVVPDTEDAPSCESGFTLEIEDTVVSSSVGAIQPTQVFSGTYAYVIGLTGDTWLGLPKVGSLKFGGTNWGSFVKNVPGTLGSRILGGLGSFWLLATIVEKVCNRTAAQGVPPDAVDLGDNAAYIPLVESMPEMAYITYFEDAIVKSENMEPGQILALLLNGVESQGWVITSQSLLQSQPSYSLEAIREAIPELVAAKRDNQPTSQQVVAYFDELLSGKKDPVWIPDMDQECPHLPAIAFDYKARVLIASKLELEKLLGMPDWEVSFMEKNELVEFFDTMMVYLPTAPVHARYKDPGPRRGSNPHDAHYTTIPELQVEDDLDINIEMRCWWSDLLQQYFWWFHLGIGPLNHGLTSSYGSRKDFLEVAYVYTQ